MHCRQLLSVSHSRKHAHTLVRAENVPGQGPITEVRHPSSSAPRGHASQCVAAVAQGLRGLRCLVQARGWPCSHTCRPSATRWRLTGSHPQVTPPPMPTSTIPPPIPIPSSGGGNKTAAVGAIFAAVFLFVAGRGLGGPDAPTLASLERASIPLDVALANGKPTVVEFYADW